MNEILNGILECKQYHQECREPYCHYKHSSKFLDNIDIDTKVFEDIKHGIYSNNFSGMLVHFRTHFICSVSFMQNHSILCIKKDIKATEVVNL